MKIVLCHFSATGNTARIADAISSGLTDLGAEVTRLDITSPEVRERVPDMSQYDAAVIGAPIHSMRTPRLVREWIETLDGQEKKMLSISDLRGISDSSGPFRRQKAS